MFTMWKRFTRFLAQLGVLRVLLLAGAAIVLVLRPAPATAPIYGGWGLFPTLIAPVLAPLFFLILILDTLMAGVMMADKQSGERRRYRLIIRVNLLMAAALLLWWWPYFAAMGR